MARIFIGYRRDDSAGHVGWLRHLLSQRFGAAEIFRDIDTIPPGVDFVEAIEAAVGSCEVLLAVIGPRWLTATDARGQWRLDHPEDFVRVEIATALERNIWVIPVLVQDARMPRSDELPPALARLARRQAVELRDASWDYDVGRLIAVLEPILQPHASTAVQPATQQSQLASQVDTLRSQLLEAESQEDWDTVIAVGTDILKLDPTDQSIRRKIAQTYRTRGIVQDERLALSGALADFEQAISLDPGFALAYNSRGLIWSKRGDLQRALADFDQAISLDPDSAIPYYNRGIVWRKQGNLDRAIKDYNQAISLDPTYARAYYSRAILWRMQGDLQRALADYTQAINLDPSDAHAYTNRGLVWHDLGDLRRALEDYTQAISLDPSDALAYHNRGRVHAAENNRAAARQDFERAAQLGHEQAKKELAKL